MRDTLTHFDPLTIRAANPQEPKSLAIKMKYLRSGKVRELFQPFGGGLLLVATDRLSAFDVIFAEGIPMKGAVLNNLSAFFFNLLLAHHGIKHHMLFTDVDRMAVDVRENASWLRGRAMFCIPGTPFPVECVVRGYLAGSGWKEYREHGTVCGIPLSPGLVEGQKLQEPIFTPSTKAPQGEHDVNISFAEMCRLVGDETAHTLRELSLKTYLAIHEYGLTRDLIFADTKLEFIRTPNDSILLADEVGTPDSSRWWDLRSYKPGTTPISFDKQPIRDWAEATGWNKRAPAPQLPPEVITATSERYLECYRILTGHELVI